MGTPEGSLMWVYIRSPDRPGPKPGNTLEISPMPTTVISNHHWREFSYRWDVPESVLASEFDYQDPEETTDGFFRYRGSWYHLDQFMRVGYPGPFGQTDEHGFHAHYGESFFSAIAIRVSDDGERYQVARLLA